MHDVARGLYQKAAASSFLDSSDKLHFQVAVAYCYQQTNDFANAKKAALAVTEAKEDPDLQDMYEEDVLGLVLRVPPPPSIPLPFRFLVHVFPHAPSLTFDGQRGVAYSLPSRTHPERWSCVMRVSCCFLKARAILGEMSLSSKHWDAARTPPVSCSIPAFPTTVPFYEVVSHL